MAWSFNPAGRRRIASGLTAVLLAVGAGAGLAAAGAAPSYAATPRNVCQPGSTKISWSNVHKPWAVDHATEYSNQTSAPETRSWKSTVVEVVRASAEADAGATYSEHFLIESLQAHVHLHLAVAGSHTSRSTESFRLTIRAQTIDIVFHAVHLVAATYTHYKCAFGGFVQNGTGTAHSWYISAPGAAVNCPGSAHYKKPAAGTPGRAALKFC